VAVAVDEPVPVGDVGPCNKEEEEEESSLSFFFFFGISHDPSAQSFTANGGSSFNET